MVNCPALICEIPGLPRNTSLSISLNVCSSGWRYQMYVGVETKVESRNIKGICSDITYLPLEAHLKRDWYWSPQRIVQVYNFMVPFPGVTQVSWESCFNSLYYCVGFADPVSALKISSCQPSCMIERVFFTYNPQACNMSVISAMPLLIFCRISFILSFSHISHEIFLSCAFIPHRLCQTFCFAVAGSPKPSWYSFTTTLSLRRLLWQRDSPWLIQFAVEAGRPAVSRSFPVWYNDCAVDSISWMRAL